MHSTDQPQIHSKEHTMTLSQGLEPILGEHQNFIENIGIRIVDNIVDLVAKQIIKESTLEKSYKKIKTMCNMMIYKTFKRIKTFK